MTICCLRKNTTSSSKFSMAGVVVSIISLNILVDDEAEESGESSVFLRFLLLDEEDENVLL